jgi:hypothetical protein
MDFTKSDIQYIKSVNAIDMNQRFLNEKESEIWGKIQYFISQFVKSRIQTLSPELIQTYQVDNEFRWDINKIKYEKDFQVLVKVKWMNIFSDCEIMDRFQEKALIHYLNTGEVVTK